MYLAYQISKRAVASPQMRCDVTRLGLAFSQIIRTTKERRIRSIFSQIAQFTLELLALELRKNTIFDPVAAKERAVRKTILGAERDWKCFFLSIIFREKGSLYPPIVLLNEQYFTSR